MADDVVDPPAPPASEEGFSQDELRGIIGEVFDEKLSNNERLAKLDAINPDSFVTLDQIKEVFKGIKISGGGKGIDEDKFLERIKELIGTGTGSGSGGGGEGTASAPGWFAKLFGTKPS